VTQTHHATTHTSTYRTRLHLLTADLHLHGCCLPVLLTCWLHTVTQHTCTTAPASVVKKKQHQHPVQQSAGARQQQPAVVQHSSSQHQCTINPSCPVHKSHNIEQFQFTYHKSTTRYTVHSSSSSIHYKTNKNAISSQITTTCPQTTVVLVHYNTNKKAISSQHI
jgi:hypothetical protein